MDSHSHKHLLIPFIRILHNLGYINLVLGRILWVSYLVNQIIKNILKTRFWNIILFKVTLWNVGINRNVTIVGRSKDKAFVVLVIDCIEKRSIDGLVNLCTCIHTTFVP